MKKVLCVIGAVFMWGAAWGQESGQEAVRLLLENIMEELEMEVDDGLLEEVGDYFGRLLRNPLDLNRASRRELEQLHFLTDFQIESLLEYRGASGNVLSATELQLVNGFDRRTVELLSPFVHFGNTGGTGMKRGWNSSLLLKWRWRVPQQEYVGEPFYSQLKYGWELPEKLRLGFLLEKDYGEKMFVKGRIPFGDFSSFHFNIRNVGLGKSWSVQDIVLGDYTVRMGQGLAVWNAFSFRSATGMQNVYRRGAAVVPYSSSDENRFFRGGAVSLKKDFGRFVELESSAFFSLKRVDAAIEDGMYTSLPDDGLHNTESRLERRKTLGEMAFGGSMAVRWKNGKAGVNYIGYGFNMHNGRRVLEYNRHQMYDGIHGNFSIDASAVVGKVRTFAEFALDYGMDVAFVCGVAGRIGKLEAMAVCRSYSKGYIAPYAGAISSISSCSNQNGVQILVQWTAGGVKLSGGTGFTYYPWSRYAVEGASSEYGMWMKGESSSRGGDWNARLYGNWKSYEKTPELGIKGAYSLQLCSWLGLKLRCEAVTADSWKAGAAAGMEVKCSLWNGRMRIVAGGALYDCRDWDCRLYMYEYDLPSSYVSTLMYGAGFRWYSMISGTVGKHCTVYVKADGESTAKIGLKVRFF